MGWMCQNGTQWRQGSPHALDATRYGVWVQDAQDAQDAGSRRGESGRNTTVSEAGHVFADVLSSSVYPFLHVRPHSNIIYYSYATHSHSPNYRHHCSQLAPALYPTARYRQRPPLAAQDHQG